MILHNLCVQSQQQTHNTVQLFDFDGVLASPLEEALFQMPIGPHDVAFIAKMASRHTLDLSQEKITSARYICIQAALYDAGIPIQPGPCIDSIGTRPFHIITARSDRFAVARMYDFIEDNMLDNKPIKTLHVDHLPKGQIIQVLLDRHPDTRYVFWDDSPGHVTSARMLRNPRLDVFHVVNDMKDFYTEAESFYRKTILELAL